MEQMKADGLQTVEINFDDSTLPETVRKLHPLVWHDGNAYCAVLGPDMQAGVFGCGETVDAALNDWDQHITDYLENASAEDEMAKFIKGGLAISDFTPSE